ncbi:MAG: hypothetical protein KKD76_00600 [Verrucomicrobia bacterium]|nr:hypothetical protein [Verrucomicrobiota bacterium]
MKTSAFKILGVICIVAGLVWSVLFPKTGYFLRPDFVASVAIGLGLIIQGVIMLFIARTRALLSTLAILFVWSVLLNVFLFSLFHGANTFIREFAAPKSSNENVDAAANLDVFSDF